MAKTNINFNNKTYQIDESSLSTATSALRTHLSTVMNGTGATINFAGVPYNIDSAKLSAATNAFVSHLGTIAGNGSKVVVGGVEYGVDSAKVAGAISDIEAVLAGTGEERLEGDGAEYYTLAPTALSFRSTAPLNELQEVQINGVTVDPSNYTLEEGSTIVTFPIEYLKTLEKGNYEVAVASDSKTVKGDFTVTAPELNEHGFYYNQPYSANLPMFGGDTAFFVREDGTFDIITVGKDLTTSTYTVEGNNIVAIVPPLGTVNCTISTDGTSIYCNEVATTFELNGGIAITADDDYVYEYKEDLGGYEVRCVDKTKAEYGAIKTGINGIDTVKLVDKMFYENTNLIFVPTIPDSVTSIGNNAFYSCTSLTSITIPDSVTSIGGGAFQSCTSLTSVTIPDSVTSIGNNAFRACKSLENIVIPDSVTSIETAFGGCSNLKSITLPFIGASKDETENTHFGYIFGAVNYQEHSKIPETLRTVTITDAANISDYAFSGCTGLTSVTIPDSVTSIGNNAFCSCTSLTSITIPDSVTSISDYAFSGCTGLTSVTIPDSVTSIGDCAFRACTGLTSVFIPNSVTEIKVAAFLNCTSLLNITFGGTIEQWNAIVKHNEFSDAWNKNVPATHVQCSDGQARP